MAETPIGVKTGRSIWDRSTCPWTKLMVQVVGMGVQLLLNRNVPFAFKYQVKDSSIAKKISSGVGMGVHLFLNIKQKMK